MKRPLIILLFVIADLLAKGQTKSNINPDTILAELSRPACACIDSITISHKTKEQVSLDIKKCIDKETGAYQLMRKLSAINLDKDATVHKKGKKNVEININYNENSQDYKKYYYELESYLMDHCPALKEKISSNDQRNSKSMSENTEAVALYNKGVDASGKEDFKQAIEFFQQALKIDSEFAFAWDNLGLAYRKSGDLDNALAAYNKSLSIDPNGKTPLQNAAIVYQYKKEYDLAIKAYQRLAELDDKNPETFYGIGQVYTTGLKDYPKGLDYMCKAYNLYVEQKSAFRADAVKIIQMLYAEFKKEDKVEEFKKILKDNGINWKE
jgi:tetratricopeptide (TPR) repeat protein